MQFFLPALTLLFITLKLTGVIAWSWWLVLLPIYVGIPLFIVFIVIIGVIAAVTKD